MTKSSLLALALLAGALPAFGADSGSMNGAQYVGGNVPGEPKQATAGSTGSYAADVDGDGCLSQTEIPPDSQLSKRFATRDANHDGKLCKDEYFVK